MATICRMSLRNNQQVAKRQVKQDKRLVTEFQGPSQEQQQWEWEGKSDSERPSRGGHQQAFF